MEIAFTKVEKDSISNTEVNYTYFNDYYIEKEKSSFDKVFLLSSKEMQNNDYGFLENPEYMHVHDFADDNPFKEYMGLSRKREDTDLANYFINVNPFIDTDLHHSYLLRDKYYVYGDTDAWVVTEYGDIRAVRLGFGGVCPAIKIDLNSNLWTNA